MRLLLLPSGPTHGSPHARPIAHENGVYHLNVRVPHDLAAKVEGAVINLPFDGGFKGVRASDKVILSLRTKDPALAKVRFRDAEAALFRHFDAVRAGPKPLSASPKPPTIPGGSGATTVPPDAITQRSNR